MSPLACSLLASSLLALGALLDAAHDTSIYDSKTFCSSLSRGRLYGRSAFTENFVIHAKGDEVTTIPNKVMKPGVQIIGDYIYVCNIPYYQPKLSTPLGIRDPLGAVYISCPKSVPGCSNLELHVTQYAEGVLPGPPPPPPPGGVLG